MHPPGSQIATLSGKNPCRAIADALAAKGYIQPEAERLAALGLGFPLGCHWSLALSASVISVSVTEDSPGHWQIVIRRDIPIRPRVVRKRTPSIEEERQATAWVYELALQLHPALRSVCDEITWARAGDAEQSVAHREPIPPDVPEV